ncbi:hypothetical protein [Oceanobacillus sp. FSL H7-0719]|uniref:hypothetical protein n=1 Tax=Oceanobacillus sp. FSL H7-0719 TaxID=2954507 RepID=UPI00325148E4
MENEILHLKLNAIIDALRNKGLLLEGEIEILNKSLMQTAEVAGWDKEKAEEYLID